MKKLSLAVLLIIIVLFNAATSLGQDCVPGDQDYGGECVAYVRSYFGGGYQTMPGLCQYNADCGAYNAWGHWDLGFGGGQIPAKNSIIVMAGGGLPKGHVAVINDSQCNSDGTKTLTLTASESNWDFDKCIDEDVEYTFYPDTSEVSRENGSSRYPVLGFIYGEQFIDIKANGCDGPVSVNSLDDLSIEISFASGAQVGTNAEWFIAVFTPIGDLYSKTLGGWEEGIIPITEMPLLDFENLPIEMKPYPDGMGSGNYTIYFAVDTVIDGTLSGTLDTSLFFDWVEVNYQPPTGDVTGTWTAEGAYENMYGSTQLILNQNGDQITGTYSQTLELYGCCGPIKLEADVSGSISGSTVQLNYTIVSLDEECSCSGGDWIEFGKEQGDQFTLDLILSEEYLLYSDQVCYLNWGSQCVVYTGGFTKAN